jgi:hypothetical protein
MGQVLNPVIGRRPWSPTGTALAGEVFDYWDVPRVGLLHENGVTFLFSCLLGEDGALSVWAYSPINEGELGRLLSTSGPAAFDALTEELLHNRWVTLAVSEDDAILHSVTFDAGVGGSTELLNRLAKQLKHLSDTPVRDFALACS